MIIKNLTLIAFVLLGALSGSNAIDSTGNGSSRQLRGNPSNFEQGLARGQETAEQVFRQMDRRGRFDCANAVGNNFRNRIEDEIIARGKDGSDGNFRVRAFNKGFRAGMEQGINDIERQCLDDSPDQCLELGNEAAAIIAARHCGASSANRRPPNFQRICREVGINQCRGRVFNQVTDLCGSPRTSDLLRLQDECEDQVDRLIR